MADNPPSVKLRQIAEQLEARFPPGGWETVCLRDIAHFIDDMAGTRLCCDVLWEEPSTSGQRRTSQAPVLDTTLGHLAALAATAEGGHFDLIDGHTREASLRPRIAVSVQTSREPAPSSPRPCPRHAPVTLAWPNRDKSRSAYWPLWCDLPDGHDEPHRARANEFGLEVRW
jgi:hypothetical protein